MEWFTNYDANTKRALQTHLREFLVHEYISQHQNGSETAMRGAVAVFELVNKYIREIEKPDETIELFLPTSHELLCEMYSFVQNEIHKGAAESFVRMMGGVESVEVNVKHKRGATPKQKNYVKGLCHQKGIALDVDSLSFAEASAVIRRLTAGGLKQTS